MKLWLISQRENTDYDTYSDAVVAAETAERAVLIPPESDWGGNGIEEYWKTARSDTYWGAWASSPLNVTAVYLGEAVEGTEEGVILASFHAG